MKKIKLNLFFMGLILILLSIIFFDNSLTANTILDLKTISFNIPLNILIISLISAFFVFGLDSLLEEKRIESEDEEARDNLSEILSDKKLDPSKLIAVRAIGNGMTNITGNKIYAGPFRPTIHFSLNGLVDINKMYGDWRGADTVILTPFSDLLDQNKKNFYGGSSTDAVFVGYATLPKETVLLKREKDESPNHFKLRVNEQIKKMGYKVLPQGDWAWGGNWEATTQFENLMKERGYTFGSDVQSPFGIAQERVGHAVLDGNIRSNRYLEKMYMMQIAKEKRIPLEYFIRVRKKDGKVNFPSIERFYKLLKENGVKEYIPYLDWGKKQIDLGDFSLGEEKKNSKLLRDLYLDYLHETVKEETRRKQRNLNDKKKRLNYFKNQIHEWKKRVKADYKQNGKDSKNLFLLNQEGIGLRRGLKNSEVEYEEAKERVRKYQTETEDSRYAGYINGWNNFWSRRSPPKE